MTNASKKKGPDTGGTILLLRLGGKHKNWVGKCPLVYMLKEFLISGKITTYIICRQLQGEKEGQRKEVDSSIEREDYKYSLNGTGGDSQM